MNDENLTLADFTELLDTHGADRSRWPPARRAAAERLLHSDPQAQRQLQQAIELEAVLDAHEVAPPSAQLRRQIAEIPLRHPHATDEALPWLLGAFWRAALSAVLVLGLGFSAGLASVEPGASATAVDDAGSSVEARQLADAQDTPAQDASDDGSEELDALMALAFVEGGESW